MNTNDETIKIKFRGIYSCVTVSQLQKVLDLLESEHDNTATRLLSRYIEENNEQERIKAEEEERRRQQIIGDDIT